MKARINTVINTILGFLLGVLGFSRCNSIKTEFRTEYGSPYADYIVSGKVTDEAGKPIENAQAAITRSYQSGEASENELKYYTDTVYTDANGEFNNNTSDFPNVNHIEIRYEAEGYLRDSTMNISPEQIERASGGWYEGKFRASDNKALKKAE